MVKTQDASEFTNGKGNLEHDEDNFSEGKSNGSLHGSVLMMEQVHGRSEEEKVKVEVEITRRL